MADLPGGRRGVLLGAGALTVLVLLTLARGPIALLAAGAVLIVLGLVGVLPLLRSDGVDWGWVPDRAQEVPPDAGIADLHRTLVADARDTAAGERLQRLVRAIAQDRGGPAAGPGAGADGPLARYLAGPPRRLALDEVEQVVAELEALSPTTTPRPATPPQEAP